MATKIGGLVPKHKVRTKKSGKKSKWGPPVDQRLFVPNTYYEALQTQRLQSLIDRGYHLRLISGENMHCGFRCMAYLLISRAQPDQRAARIREILQLIEANETAGLNLGAGATHDIKHCLRQLEANPHHRFTFLNTPSVDRTFITFLRVLTTSYLTQHKDRIKARLEHEGVENYGILLDDEDALAQIASGEELADELNFLAFSEFFNQSVSFVDFSDTCEQATGDHRIASAVTFPAGSTSQAGVPLNNAFIPGRQVVLFNGGHFEIFEPLSEPASHSASSGSRPAKRRRKDSPPLSETGPLDDGNKISKRRKKDPKPPPASGWGCAIM